MDAGPNGAGGAVILGEEGARARPEAAAPAIPPLAVSGPVVAKAATRSALRLYVPHLVDVEALDGGHFVLGLGRGS